MLGQTHFKVSTFCMGLNGKFGGLSFQNWQQFGQFCSKFWHFGRISREKNVRLGIEFETSWHEKELNSVT